MILDATFWVTISFFIFIGILVYFKVPQKVIGTLNQNITNIKDQINEAEKLKEDAKNILTEHENEVRKMIDKANDEAEKNVIKTNQEFHKLMENRKKGAEERIKQLKNQAVKDIKNASVKIAISSVEKLIKNSIDKSKLDKIYNASIEETKLALKKKSS